MLPCQTPPAAEHCGQPSCLSMEMMGSVPGPTGSSTVATFLFVNGGWATATGGGPVYGSCPTGIETLAPNKRLVFSYMVGSGNIGSTGVLTPIAVQLISQDPAQAGYQFWNYWVWPTASNTWAQAIIYFPDSPYANGGSGQSYFVNSGCGGCSWTPCTISGLEIGPGAPTANNGYDIWLDNIAFD
jgi:hypothetical protein